MKTYVRRLVALFAVAACALLALPPVVGAAASSAGAPRPASPRPVSQWIRNGWLSPHNEQLSARIDADQPALARLGIHLTQWGPDSVTGKTRIYLTHYTRSAARILRARYGSGVEIAPFSEPLLVLHARGSDVAPYDGGDFIWIPGNNAICTGGPIVEDATTFKLEMLTAGHCTAAVGNFVYRSDHNSSTSGPHMGDVVDRVNCDNCLDVSVVNAAGSTSGYRDFVWGAQYNTSNEPQYMENGKTAFPDPANCPGGAPTGCAGDLVTADGAFTGEVTGVRVFAVNQTANFKDNGVVVTTRALSEACSDVIVANGQYQCSTSGTIIGQDGDSGGPFIVHQGSEVAIAGTDVGGVSSKDSIEWYEQIGNILSKYNLIIAQ